MMLVHTCLNCILLFGIFVLVANAVNSEETTVQNATQINNQTCPMRVKGHLVNLMDEHLNDARPQIEANVINTTRLMLEEEFVPDVTSKFNQEISVIGGTLHQHTEKIGILETEDRALEGRVNVLETTAKNLALEFRKEVNRVETKFDAVVTQKNREIEELRTEHENLKLTCENLEVKTKALEGTSASNLQRIEREYKAADTTLNNKNRALESKATRIEREYKAADTTMNNKNSALETSLNGLVIAPLGTINAWVTKPSKSSSSSRTLPTCWMKCDGSVINYQNSPWKGSRVPNLNGGGRFLRGGSASQVLTMQEDTVEDHSHSVIDHGHTHTDKGHTHTYSKTPRDPASGGYSLTWMQDDRTERVYRTGTGKADITTNTANIRVGRMNTSNKGSETRPKNMIVEWIIKVC